MSTRLFIRGEEVMLSNFGSMEQYTVFDRSVLEFCRDWNLGKSEFEMTTSGSTGNPRKIILARQQLHDSACNTAKALSLQPGMRAMVCLDPRYIAGIMMLVRCLEVGMDIVSSPPSANPLIGIEHLLPIDFVALTPYQLQTILASPQRHLLNQVGTAIVGGGAIDLKTVKQLNSFNSKFYATYGMTETVSHVALQQLNGAEAQEFYTALPGVTLSTDDRQCLVIEADFIENKRVITNDLVELKGANQFAWLGRWDNVINSGGIKAYPEEIEKTIGVIFSKLGINNRFLVCGLPDDRFGQRIALVTEGLVQHEHEELLAMIKAELAPYKNPKDIVVVPMFIETETGKINRIKTMEQIPSLAPPNRRSIG